MKATTSPLHATRLTGGADTSLTNPKRKIAIIGSGISAHGVLIEIFNQALESSSSKSQENIEITVIDRNNTLYTGLAYDPLKNSLEHTVNMEVFQMSFYGDFCNWLKINRERVIDEIEKKSLSEPVSEKLKMETIDSINKATSTDGEDEKKFYPPRFIYGMYLRDNVAILIKELRRLGVAVKEYPSTEVMSANIHEDKLEINTSNGSLDSEKFDCAVFCTGHFKSSKNTGFDFEAYDPRFKTHLLECVLKKIEAKEGVNIKILGSGLTGIDVVKSAIEVANCAKDRHSEKSDFAVNIDVFSRSALLPRVRAELLDYRNKFLNIENIHAFMEAEKDQSKIVPFVLETFSLELENARKHFGIPSDKKFDVKSFAKFLSEQNSMERMTSDTRKVIDGDQKYRIWQTTYRNASLCFDYILEKTGGVVNLKEFEPFRSIHMSHVAPAPLQSMRYLSSGDGVKIRVLKSSDDRRDTEYDISVDATGQDVDLTRNPLLRNLERAGVLDKDLKPNHPSIFFAGINKETTGLVGRSLLDGSVAGRQVCLRLQGLESCNKKRWVDHPSVSSQTIKLRSRL